MAYAVTVALPGGSAFMNESGSGFETAEKAEARAAEWRSAGFDAEVITEEVRDSRFRTALAKLREDGLL